MRSAAAALTVAFLHDRQKGLSAHRGSIGGSELADGDLAHPIEALRHDFHIGLHDALAQPPELFHVLLVHDLVELFLRNAELRKQRRHREERPQEGVALHPQLEVTAIGRLPRNLESRQRVDMDLLRDDLLACPERQPLPGLLAFLFGFPDETAALLHPVERIAVGERFRIAAQHDVGVPQVAVHANALRGRHHEVGRRRTFFFRSVFRIRADVNDLLRVAEFVDDLVAVVQQIVQIADDRAEVFAGGDRAPSAHRVEADGDISFRKERRRVVGLHFIRVVDAERDETHAIVHALAVFSLALTDGELVRANRVLGPEVSRSQSVDAGEQPRHLLHRDRRNARLAHQRLVQCRADCRPRAAHRCAPG